MAITAKSTGVARDPVPAGNYFGVCVGVFDIGTQEGGKFGPKHQVVIQYELHKKKGVCRDKEGNPLRISKFYNLAFSDKADLRKDCEKILNRKFTPEEAKEGYDVTQLVDQACRMTVANEEKEDGTIRDQIDSLMALDEDDPEIKPESSSVVYELDPGEEFPEDVPEWIQKMARKSQEWEAGGSPKKANGKSATATATAPRGNGKGKKSDDDDVPF